MARCGKAVSDVQDYLRGRTGGERQRRLVFWLRMLHSCLVDADCLDTEAHFDPEKAQLRGGELGLAAFASKGFLDTVVEG